MAVLHILVSVLLVALVYGDDQHLICKQVDEVSSAENAPTSRSTSVIAQGRPGKRGIAGVKGDRGDLGPRGPAAVVHYDKIQDAVQKNLSADIATVSEKVETLNQMVSEMARISGIQKALTTENCDVFYNGRCFRAIVHEIEDVQFAAGQAICRNIGWGLANIYDDIHYKMISEYMRGMKRGFVTAWLGMTISPQTKAMKYSAGRKASDVGFQWFGGHPRSNPTDTKMGIGIRSDPASVHQGVHSWPPTNYRHGSLCEI